MDQQKQSNKINMSQLLMERQKQQKASKPKPNQVASTPANIKRLQVNRWFNSPTDALISPCTKLLNSHNLMNNRKNYLPSEKVNFDDDDDDENDGCCQNQNGDQNFPQKNDQVNDENKLN